MHAYTHQEAYRPSNRKRIYLGTVQLDRAPRKWLKRGQPIFLFVFQRSFIDGLGVVLHPVMEVGIGAFGVRRFNQQVKVVAHQTIRMHLPIGLLTRLRQRLQKILSINVIHINILPPISPTHDVVDSSRIFHSHLSWHCFVLPHPSLIVNPNRTKLWVDPFSTTARSQATQSR